MKICGFSKSRQFETATDTLINYTASFFFGSARYAGSDCLFGFGFFYPVKNDLQSLLYSIIKAITGSLPWEALMGDDDTDENTILLNVTNMKHDISTEELCAELPLEMKEICEMIKDYEDDEDIHERIIQKLAEID